MTTEQARGIWHAAFGRRNGECSRVLNSPTAYYVYLAAGGPTECGLADTPPACRVAAFLRCWADAIEGKETGTTGGGPCLLSA